MRQYLLIGGDIETAELQTSADKYLSLNTNDMAYAPFNF